MSDLYWFIVNKPFKDFFDGGRWATGLLVEVLVGNIRKRFLVGDINAFGCIAPGGKPFADDAIVTKYAIIWSR